MTEHLNEEIRFLLSKLYLLRFNYSRKYIFSACLGLQHLPFKTANYDIKQLLEIEKQHFSTYSRNQQKQDIESYDHYFSRTIKKF